MTNTSASVARCATLMMRWPNSGMALNDTVTPIQRRSGRVQSGAAIRVPPQQIDSGCDRADPTQKSRKNAPPVPSGITLAKRDAWMLRPVPGGTRCQGWPRSVHGTRPC